MVRLSLIANLSDLALLLINLSSCAHHYRCIGPKRPIASSFDPLCSRLLFCNVLHLLLENSTRRSSFISWSTEVLHHNTTTITPRYNLQMHLMIPIVILQVISAESDQHVNICSFVVHCDRMYPTSSLSRSVTLFLSPGARSLLWGYKREGVRRGVQEVRSDSGPKGRERQELLRALCI